MKKEFEGRLFFKVKKLDGTKTQNLSIKENLKLFELTLKEVLLYMPSKRFIKITDEETKDFLDYVSNNSERINRILNMTYKEFYSEIFIKENFKMIDPKFWEILRSGLTLKNYILGKMNEGQMNKISTRYWFDLLSIGETKFISHFDVSKSRKSRKIIKKEE